MCLPFEKIVGYLHYYAGRFQSRRFEHDELVNEAWIKIYPLKNIKFASAGIRWAMLYYMQQQKQQDHRGKRKSQIQSLDDEIMKRLMAEPERPNKFEEVDEARYLLNWGGLSLSDRLLIDQRYYQGLTLAETAKIHNCAKNNIFLKMNRIIRRLKKLAEVA